MIIVHVYIHVKPEMLDAFIEASVLNAKNSIKEPGILKFNLIQQKDDPLRFVLEEVYKDDTAMEHHKKTPHYGKWRETVETMMAEPRGHTDYVNIFPPQQEW